VGACEQSNEPMYSSKWREVLNYCVHTSIS